MLNIAKALREEQPLEVDTLTPSQIINYIAGVIEDELDAPSYCLECGTAHADAGFCERCNEITKTANTVTIPITPKGHMTCARCEKAVPVEQLSIKYLYNGGAMCESCVQACIEGARI